MPSRIRLYDHVRLVLANANGDPLFDRELKMRWRKGVALNEPLTFGPFSYGSAYPDNTLVTWAIVGRNGEPLDSGALRAPVRIRRGDRVVFPRGSIKSAAVGDVLGITCVFMPSGFAVGVVPPVVTAAPGGFLGGTLGDFAYADQEQVTPRTFWLPKRRWAEMPRYLDEYGQWQKRLTMPEVGAREQVRSRQQELVVAGVI